MVLFPPPFYFVFDMSNLLSNISSNELARPVMGTIFLVSYDIVVYSLFFPTEVSIKSAIILTFIVLSK